MLRFVFFDLYGTLVNTTTDEDSLPTRTTFELWVGRRFGSKAAELERARPFVDELRALRPPPAAHAEPNIAPVVQAHLRALTGGRVPAPHEVEEMAEAFRTASRRELELVPGALEAVRALRRRFGVGLISNAQLLFTRPELRQLGVPEDAFDPCLISSEVGVRKPSQQIFLRALEGAGVRACEALHVGNDPTDDVDAAAAVGLRTCLVDDPRRRSEPVNAPDLRLRSVADLPDALLGDRAPAWARPG